MSKVRREGNELSRLQVREKNEEDVEFIAKQPCRPEAVLDRNAYLVDGTARRVGSPMVDSGLEGTKKSGLWFWLLCCGLR